jgi:hypothetical protein
LPIGFHLPTYQRTRFIGKGVSSPNPQRGPEPSAPSFAIFINAREITNTAQSHLKKSTIIVFQHNEAVMNGKTVNSAIVFAARSANSGWCHLSTNALNRKLDGDVGFSGQIRGGKSSIKWVGLVN